MEASLKREIVMTVRQAMKEVLESSEEVWVTGQQLTKRFAFFTPYWLKTYGDLLPREQLGVQVEKGQEPKKTGYCYPLHRIQRMINEGKLRNLVYFEGKGNVKKYEKCFATMSELDSINQ